MGHEEDRLSAVGVLTAANYKEWLAAYKACLRMLGSGFALDDPKPTEPGVSAGPYLTERITFNKVSREWDKASATNEDVLRQHAGSVNTVYLVEGETASAWLERLAKVYDVKNMMDGAFLIEAFFSTVYTGDTPLTDWLVCLAELRNKVNV